MFSIAHSLDLLNTRSTIDWARELDLHGFCESENVPPVREHWKINSNSLKFVEADVINTTLISDSLAVAGRTNRVAILFSERIVFEI